MIYQGFNHLNFHQTPGNLNTFQNLSQTHYGYIILIPQKHNSNP